MIAVIADDFTGAAELAGIALQYNLSVRLCTHEVIAQDNDVIIVSTNSRSLNKIAAIEVTKKAIADLQKLNPTYIYKKVDSVLRGYVVDELKAQMSVLGLKRVLLLPANPSLGRTVINKKYYVNGAEIYETNFAQDPEFAIKDSSIKAMLNAIGDSEISVIKHTDELPLQGITIGEVDNEKDINDWIDKVDAGFVLAGAGDFFEQLLQKSFIKNQLQTEPIFLSPHLYVSGTSFKSSSDFIKSIEEKADEVHYLSIALMQNAEDKSWFNQVSKTIKKHQKAIIAINNELKQTISISALSLRNTMAKVVVDIINAEHISEIFIEGGSTAAAILQELDLQTFIPTHQLSRGVIRMKALQKELYITVKPGSYELPKQISKLYL